MNTYTSPRGFRPDDRAVSHVLAWCRYMRRGARLDAGGQSVATGEPRVDPDQAKAYVVDDALWRLALKLGSAGDQAMRALVLHVYGDGKSLVSFRLGVPGTPLELPTTAVQLGFNERSMVAIAHRRIMQAILSEIEEREALASLREDIA